TLDSTTATGCSTTTLGANECASSGSYVPTPPSHPTDLSPAVMQRERSMARGYFCQDGLLSSPARLASSIVNGSVCSSPFGCLSQRTALASVRSLNFALPPSVLQRANCESAFSTTLPFTICNDRIARRGCMPSSRHVRMSATHWPALLMWSGRNPV